MTWFFLGLYVYLLIGFILAVGSYNKLVEDGKSFQAFLWVAFGWGYILAAALFIVGWYGIKEMSFRRNG